jgi:hypothetical protein
MTGALVSKCITTDLIVSVNAKPRKAVVAFPEIIRDLSFVQKWRETLGTHPEPKQKEAADLAQLAQDRFVADSRVGQPYLTAAEDLCGLIEKDTEREIGGFILLRCDWFAHSAVIAHLPSFVALVMQ